MAAGGDAGFGQPIVAVLERPGRVDHQPGRLAAQPVLAVERERAKREAGMAVAKGLRFGRASPRDRDREAGLGEQQSGPAAEAAIAAEDEHLLHSSRPLKAGSASPQAGLRPNSR